jgi:F-type H+-transporting ATPase subunit delta
VDKKVKNQISELISDVFGTKADLEEVTDPEIIGGFILRVDDNYIDASVRTKLNKIRKELMRSVIPS